MNLSQDRTQEIKNEIALLNHTLKMSVQKAIRIGELLTEQKAFVGHGNFLPWLSNNFDMSERTARSYMSLFAYRDKTAEIADLQTAYKQIGTIEAQAKQSQEERNRSIITEYRKTGIKPVGWTDKLDKAMKDTDAAFAKQQERIDAHKREQNQKSQDEKRRRELFTTSSQQSPDEPPDDVDYYYRLGKSLAGDLKNAAVNIHTHTNKRNEWKEKIRLSDGGKEDAFMDALIDYMETLPNDTRRIEACNNIIKICRNISVELQRAAA
jgi:hypothetical protein